MVSIGWQAAVGSPRDDKESGDESPHSKGPKPDR
jgi:hypothetical protein